jgi:glycosyltransferase involved in cell wall biosynthesis/SAM-dependent methyltransferase
MIVRNEEKSLEACIRSFRDHVEELVIVDTGSTDGTLDIVKKYADIFEVYTGCNDENGVIASFSDARNKSFSLATKPWVMWIDGDDTVKDVEKLSTLIEKYETSLKQLETFGANTIQVLFPYEYARDETGNVIVLQMRERIVYNPNGKYWHWVNPVHEVLVPKNETVKAGKDESNEITFVHMRQETGKPSDPHRNIRILQKHMQGEGRNDPRSMFYTGIEYMSLGETGNALTWLKRYVDVTGWDDEKCLAQLRITNIYEALGQYDDMLHWAIEAWKTKESWFETHFAIARAWYHMAEAEPVIEKKFPLFSKCANILKQAYTLPPTHTVLFHNPMERAFDSHKFYNFALNYLGDVTGALASVNAALAVKHDDALVGNKRHYEVHLAKIAVHDDIAKLVIAGFISEQQRDVISAVIENKTVNVEISEQQKSEIQSRVTANSLPIPAEDSLGFRPYHRPDGYPRNVTEADFPRALIAPHAQAWAVPESFVYDDLPIRMTDDQLKTFVGTLWKEYMLHDEIQSAIKLLENAPYRIRHTDFVENLLRKSRRFIEWTNTEDTYDVGNSAIEADGSIMKHEMVPLPHPLWGAALMRYTWIRDRMHDKSKPILDFGCIDGEMTNRWGLEGYKVTGLDICSNSVEIANAKADEFKTGVTHIRTFFKDAPTKLRGRKFGYLTCADAYEHIGDRVNDLLKPARELVTDDGKMLLVTPHGAWMRGQFVSYAHPWCWADQKNEHWLYDENRGHLIAPTVWSVTDEFQQAGWYVKNCSVFNQWQPEVTDQSNVCVEALPHKPGDGNLDIVVYLGPGVETWTPNSVNLTGIGGSEMAAIQMTKRLAEKGHRVRVFSSCGQHGEGIYDGVEYYISEKYHDIKCDVLIVSRYAPALDENYRINAKVRLLWTHDVYPKGFSRTQALRADKILVLSQWHKQNVMKTCSFVHENQLYVTRNGIDLSRFEQDIPRNTQKAVYSSSPDRGLPALLRAWPKIRERVPTAELHVFYGFENWEFAARASNDKDQLQLINELKDEMKRLESMGVHYRGRMPQQDLAREFKSAGAWLYPTWFTETSCITAMEAQAAGLRIVTSPIAALTETIGPRGTMIAGDWLSPDYQAKFVDEAVKALSAPVDDPKRCQVENYAFKNFSWDGVAEEWDAMMRQMVDDHNNGTLDFAYKGAAA